MICSNCGKTLSENEVHAMAPPGSRKKCLVIVPLHPSVLDGEFQYLTEQNIKAVTEAFGLPNINADRQRDVTAHDADLDTEPGDGA